jgi:RNA polymerase sigma-70 factor (ECF subfamily)
MDKKEELTQIVKTVQRDIGQFELLYSRIINKVYFWCFTIIGNEADARDATQEAMIRIYNKLHTLNNAETFNSWMYRLVRNSCINILTNRKKLEIEYGKTDDYEDIIEANVKEERKDNLPAEALDLKETKKLVTAFVDNLPKRQKEVITLYYLEEFKIDEIAKILDYNPGSVKSRLHTGRKNLEKQIVNYQKKNNVKLYTVAILPLLGLILEEYREEICNKQDLGLDSNLYKVSKLSRLTKLANIISSHIVTIVTVAVVASIIGVLVLFATTNESKQPTNNIGMNEFLNQNLKDYFNFKTNPYIKEIDYLKFPTRSSVEISIKLKKDISDKDIKILFNSEEMSFRKEGNNLIVQIRENGNYTIEIKDTSITFEVDVIDPYASELVEAFNEKDYLLLVVNDELSQIDYEKSFVEYDGKEYTIPENLKVPGQFDGLVKVTFFNKEGYFIRYSLYFE